MGNSERHEPPTDAAIDGWFDLLDEPERPSQRPASQARSGHANLSALNEISNKVTPVMLAPVHHLLPTIEPSHPSVEPRDVWETEPEDAIDSFFTVQPANTSTHQTERKSDPEPLPPLMEMADADGEEFLDFGESPIGPIALAMPRMSMPDSAVPLTATVPGGRVAPNNVAPEASSSDAPEFDFEALPQDLPPTRRPTHVRPSHPPASIQSEPTHIVSSTPVSSGLLQPMPASAHRSAPPSPTNASDDDGFDLSDFDRWGSDGDAAVGVSPFTSGSEFTTPPSAADFSEALTIPRMSDGRPFADSASVRSVSPPRVDSATPFVPQPSSPWQTPTRPAPSQPDSQADAAHPVPGSRRPTLIDDPHETPTASPPPTSTSPPASMGTSTRPPPLPRAQIRKTTRAISVPPPPPPPARRTPQQEMHERLDLGDFAGALMVAEGLLEIDPDEADATHVANVCRARLSALYVSRLGSLTQVPVLTITPGAMRDLSLDHRAGYILSLVDGMSTLEEIVDIAAMPQIESLRTLYSLCTQQVISLRHR